MTKLYPIEKDITNVNKGAQSLQVVLFFYVVIIFT